MLTYSQEISTSTGSPQGCVLSPLLFSLYVQDMQPEDPNVLIVKYADDTILMERLKNMESSVLQQELDHISRWCAENSLIINASKTKEILFSNQRHQPDPPLLEIDGQPLERVQEYKYLGTYLNHKLNFSTNTDKMAAKANQRLYIVKQLAHMKASPSTINTAYKSFVESVLTFHLTVLYGHLTAEMKTQLNRVIKNAYKLSGGSLQRENIENIYAPRFLAKCHQLIFGDKSNQLLTLDRLPSGRFRTPRHRINLRKNSFRSLCIKVINSLSTRGH